MAHIITVTNRLTVGELAELCERAAAAIASLPNGEALYLKTTADLKGVAALCKDVIGASHQGCAESEVILEWVADDAYNVRGTHVETIQPEAGR